MKLPRANLEDLIKVYYSETTARDAAGHLSKLIEAKQHLQLASLLRNHRKRSVYSKREIGLRAGVDRLLHLCAIMEICSIASFISDANRTEFGQKLLRILNDKQVRRYYEDYYPTQLPQLFRHRLKGRNQATEPSEGGILHRKVLAFLDLDRQFVEKLLDGYLLRMLDDFAIEGYSFEDVVEIIGKPDQFLEYLLRNPDERNVPSKTLAELSVFMQFCMDLHRLLNQTRLEPLLQSAIWSHYSYWFQIIGGELQKHLGRALAQFLEWKPKHKGNDDAVRAVTSYVHEARGVLENLTDQDFGQPLNALLRKISADRPIGKPKIRSPHDADLDRNPAILQPRRSSTPTDPLVTFIARRASEYGGYGWVRDLPDARDFMYGAPLSRFPAELPPMIDLRPQCPPVYDQGQLGSCTGNAIAGAIEFDQHKQGNTTFVPSRLFIYFNERVMAGTVNHDSGAQIRDGIKSVARIGAPSETEWPYDISRFTQRPPPEVYADAKLDLVSAYARLPQDLVQMQGCLAEGYPFVFGFTCYESFESATVAETAILPMPQAGEKVVGGHCVVAVGYDNFTRMFIIRNSWGTSWGLGGYFRMPYEYMLNAQLASDFWTIRSVSK